MCRLSDHQIIDQLVSIVNGLSGSLGGPWLLWLGGNISNIVLDQMPS